MAQAEVILHNEYLTLHLLPESGGRVGRLLVRKHGLDVFKPIDASLPFDPLNWPRGGIYPLIPYSNRIADATLNFAGERHTLPVHPDAMPHTLHGVSHTLAWTVESASDTTAVLSLQYSGAHWPWPIRAEQHFELRGAELAIKLVLINNGATPMPGGMGLHPYLNAYPQMQVAFNSQRQWAITPDYLASGAFTQGQERRSITPQDWATQTWADYLSQWGGEASVSYPQGQLSIKAGSELDHLVVFGPAGVDYLCLEPVSHLANGFNLAERLGHESTGTQVITPGENFSSQVCFQWTDR
ncbi:aldose 1-epimerase [Pseudomonas sp. 21LCFQ02]|uniref:aldose epimerase family protein n=1 Tax=unclassified Pseudomonas TaxID=196821 RepID=UPI00209AEC60|nr:MULTISPECIES: aldose 1-epimerase [unclassified Pseudomonas]MCO8170855.1 aldose 1-epimerase [Pseudomonas sp. 21LCFQ02]MCQ9424548.1 aldose 1-epimerase [Pseudomonas sp. LJDD11]